MQRINLVGRDERGMALAVALFALALIGGTVAMSFLAALLEQQSGRNLLISTQAAEAADGAIWQILPELPAAALLTLPTGGSALDLGAISPQTGLTIQRQIARLADNLFLVQSRAAWSNAAGSELAARSAGLLARLAVDSASGAQILLPIGLRPWLQLY